MVKNGQDWREVFLTLFVHVKYGAWFGGQIGIIGDDKADDFSLDSCHDRGLHTLEGRVVD